MIQIKVDLKDDHQDQFEQLKIHWKFNNNTDTVRYMIKYNWEQEINQNRKFIELKDELIQEIKKMTVRKDVQQSYLIYSLQDFVDSAIKSLINEIKNKKSSIFDWDIRSTLSDEELQVSKAIALIQDSRSSKDFTLKLLLETLQWRNEEKLTKIIDSFNENQYISSVKIDNEVFYQANTP